MALAQAFKTVYLHVTVPDVCSSLHECALHDLASACTSSMHVPVSVHCIDLTQVCMYLSFMHVLRTGARSYLHPMSVHCIDLTQVCMYLSFMHVLRTACYFDSYSHHVTYFRCYLLYIPTVVLARLLHAAHRCIPHVCTRRWR